MTRVLHRCSNGSTWRGTRWSAPTYALVLGNAQVAGTTQELRHRHASRVPLAAGAAGGPARRRRVEAARGSQRRGSTPDRRSRRRRGRASRIPGRASSLRDRSAAAARLSDVLIWFGITAPRWCCSRSLLVWASTSAGRATSPTSGSCSPPRSSRSGSATPSAPPPGDAATRGCSSSRSRSWRASAFSRCTRSRRRTCCSARMPASSSRRRSASSSRRCSRPPRRSS